MCDKVKLNVALKGLVSEDEEGVDELWVYSSRGEVDLNCKDYEEE